MVLGYQACNQELVQETMGVSHLPKNSGNSGWVVNGTCIFGSFHWKLSEVAFKFVDRIHR